MNRPLRIALWIVAGPVVLGLAAAVAFQTVGAFFMAVLLAPIVGPFVGLGSDAPYFTPQFKLGLAAALLVALVLVIAGARFFEKPWGKALILLGAIGWTIAGTMGLGPS